MDDLLEGYQLNNLVNKEDCKGILKIVLKEEYKNVKLVSFTVEQNLFVFGNFGNYFRLSIKYKKKKDNQEVVKMFFIKSTFINIQMRSYLEMTKMLKKESEIYIKLINHMRTFSPNIWSGQCYCVKRNCFVMDDITLLGYKTVEDGSESLGKLQIKIILKSLATMHACSLAYEEKNNFKIGDIFREELVNVAYSRLWQWYHPGEKAIIAIALEHPTYAAEHFQLFIKTKMSKVLENVFQLGRQSKKYRNVFCHHEIWPGNVFFDKSHVNNAIFVDFQHCRYAPAALDVVMTVFASIKPSERALLDEECYNYYYEQFSVALAGMGLSPKNFITLENFLESVKEMAVYGAAYNCISATITKVSNNHLRRLKLLNESKFREYLNFDRTKEVLKFMETNIDFANYMSESVDDLMQFLIEHYKNMPGGKNLTPEL